MPAKRGTKSARERPADIATEGGGDITLSPLARPSPSNIDAEEGLLASCIMDPGQEVLALCLEAKILPDYFFKLAHQVIYSALLDLYEKGSAIDEIILTDTLQNQNRLEEIGGHAVITRLTSRIETTAHAQYWLEIVREKYLMRRLIKVSTESIDKCHHSQNGLDQLLEEVEQEIFKISQDRVSESARPLKESIDSASQLIANLLQRKKGALTGVSTGFTDLDRMTFGFHPKEMVVLAARPSLGKTSLAMNIAETAVLSPGEGSQSVPTLVFSLEMSSEQLAFRLLCSRARVNMSKVKDGFPPEGAAQSLNQAAKELKGTSLWIDDSGHLTILEMRAKARRMASKVKLGLIIIDYLQLISGTDSRMPREQQISEISRGIKAMAKELNAPVLVLSQLNRESEREKRKPRLSDLRESGSIEQDADVVLLLSKHSSKDEADSFTSPEDRLRQLIIAKQRNGPIGDLTLTFIPELTRFENHTSQPT